MELEGRKGEHIQKRKCLIHGTLQLWITVCPTTRQFQLGECKINSATKNYPAVPKITLCQNEYIVPRENPTSAFNHLNWKLKHHWRHQRKQKRDIDCFQKISECHIWEKICGIDIYCSFHLLIGSVTSEDVLLFFSSVPLCTCTTLFTKTQISQFPEFLVGERLRIFWNITASLDPKNKWRRRSV